jgi:hypothetical protein
MSKSARAASGCKIRAARHGGNEPVVAGIGAGAIFSFIPGGRFRVAGDGQPKPPVRIGTAKPAPNACGRGLSCCRPPRFNSVSSPEPDRPKTLSVIDKLPVVGGPQMAEYRAFILDEDGHIDRSVEFLCPDDEAAKKYVRQFVDGHDVELWQGNRQIATFDCELE